MSIPDRASPARGGQPHALVTYRANLSAAVESGPFNPAKALDANPKTKRRPA